MEVNRNFWELSLGFMGRHPSLTGTKLFSKSLS